jgi:predicted O-methyltransferase YrrM
MITKFKKIIIVIRLLIKRPYLINLILESDDVWKEYNQKKYSLPSGLPSIDSVEFFNEEMIIEPYAYLNGSCIPTDIALLKALAIRYNANKYFEIGTWRGESVANMATVVPECVTFNLSSEELINLGLSEKYAELHGYFSDHVENIAQIFGNSQTYNFTEHYGKYDLVFIDGDHHYDTVKKDTETAFRLLRNEKSIIVWHDYAHQPESVRWELLAGILDGCPKDKRSKIFHVSNTLCALYSNEVFETSELILHSKPKKHFRVSLKLVKQ